MTNKTVKGTHLWQLPLLFPSRCLPLDEECALSTQDSPLSCQPPTHTPPQPCQLSRQMRWSVDLAEGLYYPCATEKHHCSHSAELLREVFMWWSGFNYALRCLNLCNSLATRFSCHLHEVVESAALSERFLVIVNPWQPNKFISSGASNSVL